MAWRTWRRAQGINLASKFPTPRSDWATVGFARTSAFYGGCNMDQTFTHLGRDTWLLVFGTKVLAADHLIPVACNLEPWISLGSQEFGGSRPWDVCHVPGAIPKQFPWCGRVHCPAKGLLELGSAVAMRGCTWMGRACQVASTWMQKNIAL